MHAGLAILGAVASLSGAPVTAHQAEHALWQDAKALPTNPIACVATGRDQLCQVSGSATYTDPVFGPAVAIGTTTFLVSRNGRGYRIRIVSPERFDIYGN